MDEYKFIEHVGKTYTKGSHQDKVIRELIVRTFKPYLNPEMTCLQLGYAEGVDTQILAPLLFQLDVAEANKEFINNGLQHNLKNVRFIHTLFEDLSPEKTGKQYNAIFAIYVLEHILDVNKLLKITHSLLLPHGLLFVVVPNARALSRQLARHMGLIKELTDLTEHDIQHGHRRVYDRIQLNRDIKGAGFEIIHQGGIFLKILADFQLDQLYKIGILGPDQIEGLYQLGLEYPDLCGSIFAIARKATPDSSDVSDMSNPSDSSKGKNND